jgi:hypothetical protein
MKTLSEWQSLHKIWGDINFPDQSWQDIIMGITEENGELNHYLLKQKQGIRGTYESHEAGAKDSVGDIIVYLTHLCSLRGWDLAQIVDDTFESVLTRDWIEDRLLGGTATKAIQVEAKD